MVSVGSTSRVVVFIGCVANAACGRLAFDPVTDIDAAATPVTLVRAKTVTFLDAPRLAGTVEVTSGNLIVVAVGWNDVGGTVAVTDTLGHAWIALPRHDITDPTPCSPLPPGRGTDGQLWYAFASQTGTTTIEVQQAPSSNSLQFYVLEYGGVREGPPVTAGQSASAASNAMTAGPLSTSPLDLVVAMFANSNGAGTILPDPGWTERGIDPLFYSIVVDNLPGTAEREVTPTAKLPVGVSDACWVATAAAFHVR